MKDCDQKYPSCNFRLSHSQLPKTVLDLTGGNISHREYFSDISFYEYLSHCWAQSEHATKIDKFGSVRTRHSGDWPDEDVPGPLEHRLPLDWFLVHHSG